MSAPTITPKSDANTAQTFTILYFAAASSYTNLSYESLPAPLSMKELFPTLESRYPGITAKVLKSCAVTVNLEYTDVEEDTTSVPGEGQNSNTTPSGFIIQAGDEVGIIPPVSSG